MKVDFGKYGTATVTTKGKPDDKAAERVKQICLDIIRSDVERCEVKSITER